MRTRADVCKGDNQLVSTYEYIWECQISDEHVGNSLHGLITTNNDYKGERDMKKSRSNFACSTKSPLTNNKCIASDTEEEDQCVKWDECGHDRTSVFQGNLLCSRPDGDRRGFHELSKERGRVCRQKATLIESDGHLLHGVWNSIWNWKASIDRGTEKKRLLSLSVSGKHLILSIVPAGMNVIVISLHFSDVYSLKMVDATYLLLRFWLWKLMKREERILSSTRLFQIKTRQDE